MTSKKGQLDNALFGIIVLVMAGILVILGLIMLDELHQDTVDTTTTSVNVSMASVDESGEYVDSADRAACGFSGFSVNECINQTDEVVIPVSNYTIGSGRQGIVYFQGDGMLYNGTDWNCTYTYSYGTSEACFAANDSTAGVGDFADYFDLIALAIVIGIVLSLILMGFSKFARGRV